jgi:hypothetical protein
LLFHSNSLSVFSSDFPSKLAKKIFAIAALCSVCFMVEASITIYSVADPITFDINFEVLNSLYLSLDVVALISVMFLFSGSVTDAAEKNKARKYGGSTLGHAHSEVRRPSHQVELHDPKQPIHGPVSSPDFAFDPLTLFLFCFFVFCFSFLGKFSRIDSRASIKISSSVLKSSPVLSSSPSLTTVRVTPKKRPQQIVITKRDEFKDQESPVTASHVELLKPLDPSKLAWAFTSPSRKSSTSLAFDSSPINRSPQRHTLSPHVSSSEPNLFSPSEGNLLTASTPVRRSSPDDSPVSEVTMNDEEERLTTHLNASMPSFVASRPRAYSDNSTPSS